MITNIDLWPISAVLGVVAATAAITCAVLIFCLLPLLARYTLARPNARSSHRKPTPQGGGIAVIGATTIAMAGVFIFAPGFLNDPLRLAVVFASTIGLAVAGATDDMRPLEAIPRLLLQAAAVAIVVAFLSAELRIVPVLPWWIERALLLVAILWLVNLVNFMDGIDWMTVAEVAPVTAGLALLGLMGALPYDAMLVALALCGAIIGFAPFNRPVARLFLGDVGSLPIGLLLGWLLTLLAGAGYLAAALLLPLYYLADATITLLRRLINGEPVLQAHRSHFYQRALDRGWSVQAIVGRVFAVNVVLVALAVATLLHATVWVQAAALIAGCAVVGWLLLGFERGKK